MTPERLAEIETMLNRRAELEQPGPDENVMRDLIAALRETQAELDVRALADEWDNNATFGWLRFSGAIRTALGETP